jgi:hypothetical protein
MSEQLKHDEEVRNELPRAYISVYMPIAGWKSIMLVVDEDCGGMHTPWQTGDWAYKTKAEAVRDAKSWAEAEDIPFIDAKGDDSDAPDKSVTEQLVELIPGLKVVKL